jgi:general secretion pathway protein K
MGQAGQRVSTRLLGRGRDVEREAVGMKVPMDPWWDPFHHERGLALLVTLLIVTLVAVVVLDLNYLTRVEVHSAANFRDEVRAYYLAKSGVTLVGELFRRDLPELAELKRHLLAGMPQTLPLGEDSVTVRVVDEQGKINLNALVQEPATTSPSQRRPGAQAAEPPRTWIDITQDLFQRLHLDPTIVGAIVDWIDADELPTGPGGAESQYYRSLEKPYVARNAPMETIAELRLIRGVTDDLLLTLGAKRVGAIVDPATNAYLTVVPLAQGGRWQVNLTTAPLPILQSVTREVGAFADRLVEWRNQQWITNMAELQELGITGTALQDFQQYGTLTSTYFTVQAQGTVGEVTSQITALIQTPQAQGSPSPAVGVVGSQPSRSATGGTQGSPNPAGVVVEGQPSQGLAGGIQGSQAPTGGPPERQSQTASTQGTRILYWRVQ